MRAIWIGLVSLTLSAVVSKVSSDIKRGISPPHFKQQPDPKMDPFKPGEKVQIKCVADEESRPTYTWKKDDQPLNTSSHNVVMSRDDGTITILSPQSADEGYYQCFAENKLGVCVSIKTRLQKAFVDHFPTVTNAPRHLKIVGEKLILTCKPPDSVPKANVYWGISKIGLQQPTSIDTNDRIMLGYDGNLYFANVQMIDRSDESSKYVCIINNHILSAFNHGEDQKLDMEDRPGRLTIRPTELMWSSPTSQFAVKGDNVKMKCIFSGLPTPKVKWTRIVGGAMSNRTSVTDEGHGTEIEIKSVEPDDAGTYRCSATNRPGETPIPKDITLRVESAPVWRNNKPPTDMDRDIEADAEIECKANGVPKPTITWSINGILYEELSTNSRRSLMDLGTKLVIRALDTTDNGVIQCSASNIHGYIIANAALRVTASEPTFTATPEDKKVVEDKSTVFECQAQGSPKPTITWTKDNKNIDPSSRFIIHSNGNLEIMHAQLSDAGQYKCNIENRYGVDDADAELIVRSPTTILNDPRDEVVNAEDELTLECDATTDDAERHKLKVTWRRDGAPINYHQDPRFSMNPSTFSLTISPCKVRDTAKYTCHADDTLSTANSKPATVTVRDRPDAPTDVQVYSCEIDMATISFKPGKNNNDRIGEFIIYFNTTVNGRQEFLECERRRAGQSNDPTQTIEITISSCIRPWKTLFFYVTAVNSIGASDRSQASKSACITKKKKVPTATLR